MKTYQKLIVALALTPFAAAADPFSKQVENMECLVGSWKGSGTFAMGKDKAKVDATLECKRTSAKFGVLCSFHVIGVPGMAAYEETDLFGYEPNTDTYHWYSVTNAGETHDHVAKPSSGERIDFVYSGTQAGKAMKEAIVLDFAKDGKSVTAHNETTVDGAPAGGLDLKLRK